MSGLSERAADRSRLTRLMVVVAGLLVVVLLLIEGRREHEAAAAPLASVLPSPSKLYKMGCSGGITGTDFSDVNIPETGRVAGLKIWAGKRIRAIQTVIESNQTAMPLKVHGEAKGQQHSFQFAPGEYIKSIQGKYANKIHRLEITTNLRSFGPFGGNEGVDFEYTAPDGYEIIGFCGRADDEIDAIGVILRMVQG